MNGFVVEIFENLNLNRFRKVGLCKRSSWTYGMVIFHPSLKCIDIINVIDVNSKKNEDVMTYDPCS